MALAKPKGLRLPDYIDQASYLVGACRFFKFMARSAPDETKWSLHEANTQAALKDVVRQELESNDIKFTARPSENGSMEN